MSDLECFYMDCDSCAKRLTFMGSPANCNPADGPSYYDRTDMQHKRCGGTFHVVRCTCTGNKSRAAWHARDQWCFR